MQFLAVSCRFFFAVFAMQFLTCPGAVSPPPWCLDPSLASSKNGEKNHPALYNGSCKKPAFPLTFGILAYLHCFFCTCGNAGPRHGPAPKVRSSCARVPSGSRHACGYCPRRRRWCRSSAAAAGSPRYPPPCPARCLPRRLMLADTSLWGLRPLVCWEADGGRVLSELWFSYGGREVTPLLPLLKTLSPAPFDEA